MSTNTNYNDTTITKHIDKNPGVCGGKACVAGTRIRVQDIYVWHELQNKRPDEIVTEFPQLSLGDVYAALAYYWDHRDEIHQELDRAEKVVAELQKKYPSKLQAKLQKKNVDRNAR